MFRKAFKRLTKVTKKAKKPSTPPSLKKPSPRSPPSKEVPTRILTAEGWMRLMMKKHRKSN